MSSLRTPKSLASEFIADNPIENSERFRQHFEQTFYHRHQTRAEFSDFAIDHG